ncbi:unnamed protein product, partial [Owenia fusiformis]
SSSHCFAVSKSSSQPPSGSASNISCTSGPAKCKSIARLRFLFVMFSAMRNVSKSLIHILHKRARIMYWAWGSVSEGGFQPKFSHNFTRFFHKHHPGNAKALACRSLRFANNIRLNIMGKCGRPSCLSDLFCGLKYLILECHT